MRGIDGFLGSRATFTLDVVVLAMIALVPVLVWSIWLVHHRKQYALHRRVQLTLGVVLLVTVALFEIDIRLNGWRDRASASPFTWREGGFDWVYAALAVHLCFAITATVLWAAVIIRALRFFPASPMPGAHSDWHRRFGYAAAIDMLLTAVTGWIFYWVAFVA